MGKELARLHFKVTFLQEQCVINESFELVIGMGSLHCKWLQTQQEKVM